MTNWVLDTDEVISKPKKGSKLPKKINWVLDEDVPENENKEGIGKAALMAIPRIGSDLINKGYETLQKTPEYWNKYKTELPGFWKNVFQHPKSFALQGLAGANEAVNALNQSIPALARYGEERLNLLPKGTENAVKRFVPEDTTEAINQLFDQPQHEGEALLRGTARNAANLAGIGALFNRFPHLTKKGATRRLNRAQQLANEREIGALEVNPELIEDARQFLPNILRNRNALDSSHAGDYNSLFKLQSELGQLAGQQAKSWFSPSERIKGRAGLEARNNLLDALHENLMSQGHLDISKLLKEGQNDYRRYMKYRKLRNAAGGAAAIYAAPKDPIINFLKHIYLHGH